MRKDPYAKERAERQKIKSPKGVYDVMLEALADAVFASWPEEDVAQYLALSERYLTALREQVRQL